MTIEEMIKDCERKRKDGEIMVFALGVGRVLPKLGKIRLMRQTMNCIKKMEGFLGVHSVDLWHNLLIFKTLNDAKRGKNELIGMGCSVGEIAPILIKEVL